MDLGADEVSDVAGDKMSKLKLLYVGHITRRQGPLEETVLLRKLKAAGKDRDQR